MKLDLLHLVTAGLAGLLLLGSGPAAATADTQEISAHAHLLIGFPDAENTSDTLVVPGTVIPIDGLKPRFRFFNPTAEKEEESRAAAIAHLAANLQKSLRLENVEVEYGLLQTFRLNEPMPLPGPGSDLSLQVTLLGASPEVASFRIQFAEGDEILADSRVAIPRGEPGVIGSRDGEDYPYIFLVLEPKPSSSAPQHVVEGITPPRVIHRARPLYTEEARKLRIQGVVILQAVIETDGTISNVKVLKGLPEGLSEAATEAIRQWTFQPALDPDGKPVRVYYNLTINFRLDPNKEEAPAEAEEP